jgi:hypothetical protein
MAGTIKSVRVSFIALAAVSVLCGAMAAAGSAVRTPQFVLDQP